MNEQQPQQPKVIYLVRVSSSDFVVARAQVMKETPKTYTINPRQVEYLYRTDKWSTIYAPSRVTKAKSSNYYDLFDSEQEALDFVVDQGLRYLDKANNARDAATSIIELAILAGGKSMEERSTPHQPPNS